MKKVYLLLIAVVVVSGCAPALQIGTSLSGDLAAHMLKSYHSNSAKSIVLGAQLESYRVGKYEIKMFDGSYKQRPCIFFAATASDNNNSGTLVYLMDDEADIKRINDFKRMDRLGKKQLLIEDFLKCNFDLGPIESETPKETTVSTPSSLPENIPTPVFAPDLIKPLQP